MAVRIVERTWDPGQACVVRARPDMFVCAECRFAHLFAVEPRAICTKQLSRFWGRDLFAGQPACEEMEPRSGIDLTLSVYRHNGEA